VAALTTRGIIAPWVLDGLINRDALETYVEKVLVPELPQDAVVVMDNLSSHKGPRIREMIEAPAQRSSIFRLTAPTSTRSRTPSPSSKQICERPPNEPSMASGMPVAASSTPTRPQNQQTTSKLLHCRRIFATRSANALEAAIKTERGTA
jgi:hypothetical protein